MAEVDSIEIEARAARPSTPMHVMDWAQAQWEGYSMGSAVGETEGSFRVFKEPTLG